MQILPSINLAASFCQMKRAIGHRRGRPFLRWRKPAWSSMVIWNQSFRFRMPCGRQGFCRKPGSVKTAVGPFAAVRGRSEKRAVCARMRPEDGTRHTHCEGRCDRNGIRATASRRCALERGDEDYADTTATQSNSSQKSPTENRLTASAPRSRMRTFGRSGEPDKVSSWPEAPSQSSAD